MITSGQINIIISILERAVGAYERSVSLAERAYQDHMMEQNEEAACFAEAKKRLEDELIHQQMQGPTQLSPIQQYTEGLGGLLRTKK